MRSSSSSDPAIATGAQRLAVAEAEAGLRLDKWLSGQHGIHSREMARRLIVQGEVRLNAASAEPATRLRAADVIEFRVPPPIGSRLVPEPATLDVLHEDAHLLVLNKPPGVTVHPSPGHPTGTLVHQLLSHCKTLSGVGGVRRPGIVHRLDKDTSGVLVVAKTDPAHLGLQQQFRVHSIERAYRALVVGVPRTGQGTIDLPLGRDPKHRLKQAVRPDGKPAVTHWRLERRLGAFALLQVRLETGRTHQIRVHLAHSDTPVMGDRLYGRGRHRGLALAPELMAQLDEFRRQALHAAVLGFAHPITGEWLRFEAPLPPDFARLVERVAAAAAAA